jgi:hypothetical protein
MSTRFATDSDIVRLPAKCETGSQTASLEAKREAQLKWMKENGVRYLGGLPVKNERRAPRPPAASLLSNRAPIERPGDAIVRDLASNG